MVKDPQRSSELCKPFELRQTDLISALKETLITKVCFVLSRQFHREAVTMIMLPCIAAVALQLPHPIVSQKASFADETVPIYHVSFILVKSAFAMNFLPCRPPRFPKLHAKCLSFLVNFCPLQWDQSHRSNRLRAETRIELLGLDQGACIRL